MANINLVNIGNLVNDGTGDDLRTAFQKVNANFSSLAAELTPTAINVGDTGSGVFKEKVNNEFRFKKLVSGTNISIDDTNPNSLTINNTAPRAFIRFDTDSGSILATTHQQLTLQGTEAPGSTTRRKDIEVTASGSSIFFKTIIPVTDILTSYDFGPIDGSFATTTQLALAASNIDFGTADLPSRISLDCGRII